MYELFWFVLDLIHIEYEHELQWENNYYISKVRAIHVIV
jgi:hypothetical protein